MGEEDEEEKEAVVVKNKKNKKKDSPKKKLKPQAKSRQKRLDDLEAKAVAEAKASADTNFKPSKNLMNSSNAKALLGQVDGPSLAKYENKESTYVGRAIPISAGGKLDVPVHVVAPGSVVEYAVEIKKLDISISISAERDEGVTVVK